MAKIGIKDRPTIDVINKIYNDYHYPVAASLLVYAIIERILKEYIIKHRKNSSVLDYSYCKCLHSGPISLQKYYNYNSKDFIKKFIKNITLGDAQKVVNKNKIKNKVRDYATARNNLMHSNSYLLEENKKNKEKRTDINNKNYIEAIKHLEFVVNNFSDFKVKRNESVISVLK